jgi:putative transposase
VQYINHRYGRTGTLWEGRYKATLLDTETYLFTCYRYVELNPVRAEMVVHPAEYPWSSYRYNALGTPGPLITPHPLYTLLDQDDDKRRSAYQALFDARIDSKTLAEIRAATNKAWVLGDDRFREKVARLLNRPASPRKRGRIIVRRCSRIIDSDPFGLSNPRRT